MPTAQSPEFKKAQQDVKKLKKSPDTEELLKVCISLSIRGQLLTHMQLYALYKVGRGEQYPTEQTDPKECPDLNEKVDVDGEMKPKAVKKPGFTEFQVQILRYRLLWLAY